ncbi:MAG: hypothetical protein ACKODC_09805, partial [Limnohabitans sp.]
MAAAHPLIFLKGSVVAGLASLQPPLPSCIPLLLEKSRFTLSNGSFQGFQAFNLKSYPSGVGW